MNLSYNKIKYLFLIISSLFFNNVLAGGCDDLNIHITNETNPRQYVSYDIADEGFKTLPLERVTEQIYSMHNTNGDPNIKTYIEIRAGTEAGYDNQDIVLDADIIKDFCGKTRGNNFDGHIFVNPYSPPASNVTWRKVETCVTFNPDTKEARCVSGAASDLYLIIK